MHECVYVVGVDLQEPMRLGDLVADVQAASFSSASYISSKREENNVCLCFDAEPDAADMATLNGVVAAYTYKAPTPPATEIRTGDGKVFRATGFIGGVPTWEEIT